MIMNANWLLEGGVRSQKGVENQGDKTTEGVCAMLAFRRRNRVSAQPVTSQKRKSVRVRGVVRGVGFRPFVYRLATEGQLSGHIGNDTDGVIIEVEGADEGIAKFLARLRSEPPPMA